MVILKIMKILIILTCNDNIYNTIMKIVIIVKMIMIIYMFIYMHMYIDIDME